MPSVIQWGGFDSAFFWPMTRRFERTMVGARPVVDGTAQKHASKKLLITRNSPPPDLGPPPSVRGVWDPNTQTPP